MTGAKPSPNLPWWVAVFTTHDTTRKRMRRDAWVTLLAGALVLVACAAAVYGRWPQAAWAGLLPAVVLVIVGLWTLAAVSWLDRNQAWDRLSVQPLHPRSSRLGGLIVFLVGLLFLTLAGWRFWVCFLGPDDSLLWHSEPFVEESRQVLQEHRDRVKDIKARKAMKEEYPAELLRYEAADAELRRRQEAEMRVAAPRWRWLELGTASLVLLFGLALGVGGYMEYRGIRSNRAAAPAPEPGAAPDPARMSPFRDL
jgi:hypothetical protein